MQLKDHAATLRLGRAEGSVWRRSPWRQAVESRGLQGRPGSREPPAARVPAVDEQKVWETPAVAPLQLWPCGR